MVCWCAFEYNIIMEEQQRGLSLYWNILYKEFVVMKQLVHWYNIVKEIKILLAVCLIFTFAETLVTVGVAIKENVSLLQI